jgi:hypothetical protein
MWPTVMPYGLFETAAKTSSRGLAFWADSSFRSAATARARASNGPSPPVKAAWPVAPRTMSRSQTTPVPARTNPGRRLADQRRVARHG